MKVYAVKTSLEYMVEIEAGSEEEAVLKASELPLDRWRLCSSNIRGYDAWEEYGVDDCFIRKAYSS